LPHSPVHFGVRASNDDMRAQSARTIFHATSIDGANFSARDPPRRFFCRQSGFYQPNARRGA